MLIEEKWRILRRAKELTAVRKVEEDASERTDAMKKEMRVKAEAWTLMQKTRQRNRGIAKGRLKTTLLGCSSPV